MGYDAALAERIRAAVESAVGGPQGYREIAMFGGLCWTVNTHMAVGAADDDLPAQPRPDAWVFSAVERARAKPPKRAKQARGST